MAVRRRTTSKLKKRSQNIPTAGVSPIAGNNKDKETTRNDISIFFIRSFVFVVAGVMIVGLLRGYTVAENKDMLLAVSGVLSGPLGFIIGYYFKSQE